LLAIAFRDRIRDLERTLARDVALGPLKADVVTAALERTFSRFAANDAGPTSRAALKDGRSRFNLIAQEIARAASGILAERAALEKTLTLHSRRSRRLVMTSSSSSGASSRPAGSLALHGSACTTCRAT